MWELISEGGDGDAPSDLSGLVTINAVQEESVQRDEEGAAEREKGVVERDEEAAIEGEENGMVESGGSCC